jgi:Mrp family chromosome partitioning ATPase
MMVNAADNGADKVLELLKKHSKILYPDLILPRQAAVAAAANADFDAAGQPVSWQSFPLLQRMRGSLNFLWGRLLLQWAEERADIAFYGCSENVGNTFISFHLAAFVAMSNGLKTIYVDTDCDSHPDNSHPIGQTDLPGLLAYYYEGASLEDCIHPTRIPGLYVMPSGKKVPGQPENSIPPTGKIKKLAEFLRERFQLVIYDCQPVLVKPIEIVFAQHASNCILVSRYATSRREICEQTLESFNANKIEVTGVVLNQREYPIPKKIYDLLK